jgi:hypothetical protein
MSMRGERDCKVHCDCAFAYAAFAAYYAYLMPYFAHSGSQLFFLF